jgi:uncharacterized protein (TIGR02118 family)
MSVVIKRLTQWNNRKEMSREDALRYWRDQHVRLVEKVPGLRGYVQNLCTVGPDGAEPPYAGLGEVWSTASNLHRRPAQLPSGAQS